LGALWFLLLGEKLYIELKNGIKLLLFEFNVKLKTFVFRDITG
jgi:hypothetical protein